MWLCFKQRTTFSSFNISNIITHREQHTPALSDGSTAAQEANDHQHSAHGYEQVGDVGQLRYPRWSIIHILQYTQKRTTVHLHPYSHTQDGCTCQLQDG